MNKVITAKLNARGFVSRAAEAIGVTASTISQVIAGTTISLPTAKKIAKLIDTPVHLAFPNTPQYQPHYNLKKVNARKREIELNKFRERLTG